MVGLIPIKMGVTKIQKMPTSRSLLWPAIFGPFWSNLVGPKFTHARVQKLLITFTSELVTKNSFLPRTNSK